MATTSSYRKPGVSPRSVSLPQPQAPSSNTTNGKIADTTDSMEIEYRDNFAAQHNNVAGGSARRSHGRSTSHHANTSRSFSARAKNTPQMSQDIDALNQQSPPPREVHQPTNPLPSTEPPYSYDHSPSSHAQNRSPHTHRSTARAGFDSPRQESAQISPNDGSQTRNSPKDGHPQRTWTKTRSPLTTLQGTLRDISKEEKRARMEEAEMLLRENQAGRQKQPPSSDAHPSPTVQTTQKATQRNDDRLDLDIAKRPRRSGSKQSEIPQKRVSSSHTKTQSQRQSPDGTDTLYTPRQEHDQPAERTDRGASGGPPEHQLEKVQVPMSSSPLNDQTSTGYDNIPPEELNTTRDFNNASAQEPNINRHQDFPRKTSLSKDGKMNVAAVGRSDSRKLQKPAPREHTTRPPAGQYPGQKQSRGASYHAGFRRDSTDIDSQNTALHPVTDQADVNSRDIPPIGLGLSHADNDSPSPPSESPTPNNDGKGKQKQAKVSFDVPPPTPPPLSEWKSGSVCKLRTTDFDLRDSHLDKAWWETGGSRRRRQSQKIDREDIMPRQKLAKNARFEPPLLLKCGPLLRFTGIKHQKIDGPSGPAEQEIWRGSIMIVTKDSSSTYDPAPVLRLFSQPMSLLPPPPAVVEAGNGNLAPEYVDPIAGVAKMGQNGKLLYVKPVDHIEEELDLSFVEGDDGLFEESPSPLDYNSNNQVSQAPDARIQRQDGESVGKYKEIEGVRLYADSARDVTFWRFSLEIELGERQERIAYRINHGSAVGFWVPAKGQSMSMMFYSGNEFGTSVDTDKYSGPDPMWRDVLNNHQTRPFHVMIGGGGQISSDSVSFDTTHFQQWLDLKTRYEQYQHALNLEIKAELESFFLEHYSKWFSQGLFSMANSQIPMVNMWDGRDIMAGFGSYSDEFMSSPVFSGLGSIAFKYYLLFQHQTVPEETHADEPSWLFGIEPGPYIKQKSRSILMNLGKRVALLAVDCRTERTREYVLSDDTYDHIWDRCYHEIEKGEVKHLLILLAEPVASPRLAWVQNVLSSRAMEPVRALGRRGLFGGVGDNFENDTAYPDDQWTAKIHKEERRWLVEDLQELAAERSVRITVLGGGDTLAAIGQFYSNPKLQLSKDQDYRYMLNVISSGIVNAPMSDIVNGALGKRSKSHVFDTNTVEDMRAIFMNDVDGKPKSNKRLMPRRNWCSIREYMPGTTPPQTPSETSLEEAPPPTRRGSLMRSLSMSHGDSLPGKLMRRSSQRGPPPSRWPSLGDSERPTTSYDGLKRSNTLSNAARPRPSTGVDSSAQGPDRSGSSPQPGNLVRRRTDLSSKELKTAAKGGPDLHHFINLKTGLDITLNCEVNPKDSAGITTPYRILVPALWFDGEFEPSVVHAKKQWWRFGRKRGDHPAIDDHSPTSPQSADDEEDPEDEGYFVGRREKAGNGLPRLFQKGETSPTEFASAGGKGGMGAPQPRKRFLGIF